MNIDIKYLDVRWSDKETVLKIDYSEDSLAINQSEDYLQVESTTFKNYLPRLGFRILDRETLHCPCFFISDTKTRDLLPVVDPTTHETWWIESSGWDNKEKRHHSELYRTVGSVTVKIQNKTLRIINNSLRFTVDELEAYLRDFKNDLWMLILNAQGYIKGAVERELPSIFRPEMISHLYDYADAIEKIIKKPTNELKEIQVVRPIRLVKPTKKTFMELAAKGNPKYLSSRASQESYDTPDNRYIHYTLKNIMYLINQVAVLGSAQDSIYERIISYEKKRLYSLVDSKQVDPIVFGNEIKSITEKIEEITQSIDASIVENGTLNSGNELTYRLKLTKKYGREESNKYFCDYLNGDLFKEKYGTYLVAELNSIIPMDNLVSRSRGIEIEVTGVVNKAHKKNNAGDSYYYINFVSVSKLLIISHPLIDELARLESRKCELVISEWVVPYTSKERQEVESERKFLRKKIELLSARKDDLKGFNISVVSVVRRIRESRRFFEKSAVGISGNFPNTMVFVQNPSYGLAKSSFSQISNINGMDDSLFSAMMSIDEIGLVNISNLYEKWCLLQIIKVLTEVYSFAILENWQQDLVKAVSNKKYNIQFTLMSATLGRSIILTYEKELESGRRPDYVVDVFGWRGEHLKRYVLDAKFKDTLDDSALERIVNELYTIKDYSEGQKNKVFILHASDSAITQRTSPLDWGGSSDYGQVSCHRYGGVYLSPSHKHGRSLDNLQRLMGLFIQETNSYEISELESNPHHPFCVACGNSDANRLDIRHEKTQGGGDKWIVLCSDCSHLQVRSFCRSCKYPLNKNGYYWTYHRTRAEQPFNIVCPNCEEFL